MPEWMLIAAIPAFDTGADDFDANFARSAIFLGDDVGGTDQCRLGTGVDG